MKRDQELGILDRFGHPTREPNREDLEAWAVLVGYDPVRYMTAWVYQASSASPTARKESPASGED